MAEDSAAPHRLIIVDQGLRQLGGHHAEYSLSVASRAAPRRPVVILAHHRCSLDAPAGVRIVPTFRFEWMQAQRSPVAAAFDPAVSFNPCLFLSDLRAGLASVGATAADHVFIHTIGFDEIGDLLTMVMTSERWQLPVFHILLRRDLDEIGEELGRRERFCAYVRAFAGLGYWPDRVRFYADTGQLSAHYAAETGVPFATLPIPFDEAAAARALAAGAYRDPERPVVVGYLGNAREEKGYHLLPEVAVALREHRAGGKAVLRLHSVLGEARMLESRRQLEWFQDPTIELINRPLSGEEYYRELGEMDVVLLPYLAERYRRRSSGIFAQAVATGKIVVVPRGTTMLRWAEELGLAGCIPYDGPADLPAAVATAIDRSGELHGAARRSGEEWLARQPTQTLLDTLFAAPRFAQAELSPFAGPRILHILDGTALERPDPARSAALCVAAFQRLRAQVATIIAVAECPTPAELQGWTYRAYRHWVTTQGTFCWLMYLTQPGEEPLSVAAELRNIDLLSIPETLPPALAGAEIDLIWTDSLGGLAVADMLGLSDGIPLVCDNGHFAAISHALRRRGPLLASELCAELSLLQRGNIQTVGWPLQALYLPEDGASALAAFCFSHGSRGGEGAPLAADVVFLRPSADLTTGPYDGFCQAVYQPHLAPLGVNLAVAGPGREEIGDAARAGGGAAAQIATPIASLDDAAAAGRVFVMPIATDAELTARLLAQAQDLPDVVTIARDAATFAAWLGERVEASLRPAPPPGSAYLPAGAAGYVARVEKLLRAARCRSR